MSGYCNGVMWAGDGSGALVTQLRRQQVSITRHDTELATPKAASEPRLWTRAERAHRRQSWASRLARNACGTATPRYTVTLAGIAPALTTVVLIYT
jgi:hypothetical protein